MTAQNNRSSSGFTLGMIFGLLVGFLIAVLLHKRNPKLFAQLADKLNDLIKDISSGSIKVSPSKKSSSFSSKNKNIASSKSPSSRRPRRPKTFVRNRS